MLYLLPADSFSAEMWSMKNAEGMTPCDCLNRLRRFIENANRNNPWQKLPATEKQKGKLAYFGCTWDEGITKKQASDALDKCVRDFPDLNKEYYGRPATPEQLAYLSPILAAEAAEPDDYAEPGKPLTYGRAKDLIWDCEMEEREKAEEEAEKRAKEEDKLLLASLKIELKEAKQALRKARAMGLNTEEERWKIVELEFDICQMKDSLRPHHR